MMSATPGSPFSLSADDGAAGSGRQDIGGDDGALATWALNNDIEIVPEDVPIIRHIGSGWEAFDRRVGGMGEVYFCIRKGLPRVPFALKSISRRLVFDPASRRAFERECGVAVRLSAVPGVLPVIWVERIDGELFIVMPAVPPDRDGVVNLGDVLERGGLSVTTVLFYAHWIARTLHEAGVRVPGVVHGDLKPENFLMHYGLPAVTDFGLARTAREQVRGDVLISTPQYRAPELADSSASVTAASDVFSFGVMLDELLAATVEQIADIASSPKPTATVDCDDSGTPEQTADEQDSRHLTAQELKKFLLTLASLCTDQAAENRPEFGVIESQLSLVIAYGRWEPPPEVRFGVASQRFLALLQASTLPSTADSLIRIGRPDLALDSIDGVGAEDLDSAALTTKAIALLDLGRHDQAMQCFDLALLRSDDSPEASANCWNLAHERAVCLKRMRRYEAAIVEFTLLVGAAADQDHRCMALSNLGSTYIEVGRYREAEEALRVSLQGTSRGEAATYVNLAVLSHRKGNYQDAIGWLRRAVGVEPLTAKYHVMLGEILMDRLGADAAAAAAFRNAMNCGLLRVDVFARAIACAVILSDQVAVEDLWGAAGRSLSRDEIVAMHYNVLLLLAIRRRMIGNPSIEIESDLPQYWRDELDLASGFLVDPAGAGRGSVPAIEASEDASPVAPVGAVAATGLDTSPMHVERTRDGLVYDFYLPFDTPGYLDLFLTHHRLATIVRAVELDSVERAGAPQLTVCDYCGIEISTNRDVGSYFVCRVCSRVTRVDPVEHPPARRLAAELGEAVGRDRRPRPDDGYSVLAAVQPKGDMTQAEQIAVRYVARLYGFEPLLRGHSALIWALIYGSSQGSLDPDAELFAAVLTYQPGEYGPSRHTPPEVEKYLVAVRAVVPHLRVFSISHEFRTIGGGVLDRIMQGDTDGAEKILRQSPEGPADAVLWNILATHSGFVGDHAATERRIHGSMRADRSSALPWVMLGRLRLEQGNTDLALQAAEYAMKLDPAGSHYGLLADCHFALGDTEKANLMAARATASGKA